ncbi:4-hydroxyacetophenone monooxygenase [Novosphingobium hassiacum]|uniref:4-hydroxyacetophenone monooxygenase n=1 Tax=Novosphingobium hassiacum TaxID=173676 RepID=A0A7W5ZX87_9SPHN|nr:NAD(P)/FAD-dependent oxidoreductase [Novosphingobium hassiacum]MBB3860189.1 4-hydroxyacetophenone monooxygenase [Novosphingobium hassiacum]
MTTTTTEDIASSQFDEVAARDALAMATTNVLRIALYQATGDEELALLPVIKASFWAGAYEVPVLDPAYDDLVREKALAFLRSGKTSLCEAPDDAMLHRLMENMVGEPVNDYLFSFGKEEANFTPFPRGVEWPADRPSAETVAGYNVIVIGAGAAGLVAAAHLRRLGIAFTVIERNHDVGGTWLTNDYPDARVDIASHHYQLTLTRNHPWKHWYATQGELLDYLRGVADEFDLRPDIRFETELTDASWNEQTAKWDVALRAADGSCETLCASFLISAAGLFNAPNMPDIPGIEEFAGPIFHTTQWPHDYDYAGKRAGVIGVGCTGAQLMPAVARKASHVSVFQRSPHWVSRMDHYRDPVPDAFQWLMDNVPHYWNWHCFNVFYTLYADDGALQQIDPEWQAQGGQINRKNDLLRENIRQNIIAEFPDDPAFAASLMPSWPPFAKRLVVDNGWFDALKQPHVDLVTQPIERMEPRGIMTADGRLHELDMIVVAGGFKAERYLWPVAYTGRAGVTLEQAWAKDGARSYVGVTMPDFPNMFIIYGPNMQARSGGLFAWIELWARYSLDCIVQTIAGGHRTIECRREVFDAYNDRLDAAQDQCIWGMDGIKSYYLNEHGRQVVNNPMRPSQTYASIRHADLADYHLDQGQQAVS